MSHSTDYHDKHLYQYQKATTYTKHVVAEKNQKKNCAHQCQQKQRIRQAGSTYVPNIEKFWCVVVEKTVVICKNPFENTVFLLIFVIACL